jgi:DNA repair protein RadC
LKLTPMVPDREHGVARSPRLSTREIKAAAEALGIAIHGHLVIGRKGHASFRSLGLLS